MSVQTTLPEEYGNLTGRKLERAIARFEYDLADERVQQYMVDISKELPEPTPLISIDGQCVCSRGNISVICGEAKSKKTFLASALVAGMLAMPIKQSRTFKNVKPNVLTNVLWLDTEQGMHHVRKVVKRINDQIAFPDRIEPRLTTLSLRELDPKQRKGILYDAVRVQTYDLIVIDGIADLQRNTNDLEESDALINELMALSTKLDCHIMCILHTNPGTDKARGHLGSSLQRKAESVIYVHRNGEISVVEPQFCRNEPFERFAFMVNEDGLPEVCDLPERGSTESVIVGMLRDSYGGRVERAVLVNKVQEQLGIGVGAARMKVHRLTRKGVLGYDEHYVWIP